MAKAKAQKTVDIWKKKKWHKIVAPRLFNEHIIGETPALEPNLVIGRTIKASLMNLIRDIKRQQIDITFIVDKVMGDTAYTSVKKYEINPSWIKRSVRRDKNRIDDSFTAKTADGYEVRLKPFLLTRSLTYNSKCTDIRNNIRKFLKVYLSKINYDTLVKELINTRLQRSLRDSLKNIYSMKTCEIRFMDVLKKGEKKIVEKKPVEGQPEIKPKVEEVKTETKTEVKTEAPKAKEEKPAAKVEEKPEVKEVPKVEVKPKAE